MALRQSSGEPHASRCVEPSSTATMMLAMDIGASQDPEWMAGTVKARAGDRFDLPQRAVVSDAGLGAARRGG